MVYNNEEYINLIRSCLKKHRFVHSINVADKARELAKKYGADEEKAYTAGILHDIMKEEDYKIQLDYIKKAGMEMSHLELNNKAVYHQKSGMAFVKLELGIDDEDILNAIRYHTTGRRDMTLLEQVLYLADLVSADRDYPDIEETREKVNSSLGDGLLHALKFTITDLASKEKEIHPDTLEAYNWVIEKYFEKANL